MFDNRTFYILKEQLRLETGEVIAPGTMVYARKADEMMANLYLRTMDDRNLTMTLISYYPKMTNLPKIDNLEELNLARLLFS